MTEKSEADRLMAGERLRYTNPGEYLLGELGEATRDRLIATITNGVPADSLVVAARWWQLETYLRLHVYIQLKALFGPDWQNRLTTTSQNRAEAAQALGYMKSADDAHLLAHADVSLLFKLIDEFWDQCDHGIGIPREVWKGRIEEILPIRHRLAHCRRPHIDDVRRIEQLLRDLESGANRALRTYVQWWDIREDLDDPVVKDWMGLRHPVAARLVKHGYTNKGIYFELKASHLPWVEEAASLTGVPGWFWVMHVNLDRRHIFIDDYWSHPAVQRRLPLIGHIIQPSPHQLAVTIPAVGDPQTISDTIGDLLDAVFAATSPGDAKTVRHPWRRSDPQLDPRVDAEGLLSILSGLNAEDPVTIFAARM